MRIYNFCHTNFIKDISVIVTCSFILFSCVQSPLEHALKQDKGNRGELEKVLLHYKNDELKWQAARFLIENMDVHYSYKSDAIELFYKEMDSLYKHHTTMSVEYYQQASNELLEKYWLREAKPPQRCRDIETITSDFLIAHIDSAFCTWKSPWNSKYDFEHFCNYVLPYRIGKEPISHWYSVYHEQYKERLKGYQNEQGNNYYMYGIYGKLNSGFSVATYYPNNDIPEFPLSFLASAPVDNCVSYAARSIAQFRTFGLPAVLDFVPQWGDRSMGHSWAVFLPNEKSSFPFGANENLGEHLFNRSDGKIPKVFRRMFQKQQAMRDIFESREPRPELFQTCCLKDVTNLYVRTTDAKFDCGVTIFQSVTLSSCLFSLYRQFLESGSSGWMACYGNDSHNLATAT